MRQLSIQRESFPIRGVFRISRGARTEAHVVTVTLTENGARGWGECVPYARYDETLDSVIAEIEAARAALESGIGREELLGVMKNGAARNAVDCALWDLEAKLSGTPVWQLAGLASAPKPLVTAYTISLDAPEAMGKAAAENADRPLLKLKLTGEGDLERVEAIHHNAPKARLIVDANEGWSLEQYLRYAPALVDLGVEMIEQPLKAADDAPLAGAEHPLPVCADESCHDLRSLEHMVGKYEMINIKLDKTGGLTEALRLKAAAEKAGLGVMLGCMLGTSLSMAPGVIAGQGAKVVDLDAPLLLAHDREGGLTYEGSIVHPPKPSLWG
ncbi:MAG: dipeptide epimerase [Alphaproteobacteria bacterium]|nr:dipeptide epimerase [Alphaproteobacteria bacterium]MBU0798713.1 dipeptide epimerase [Alphaproteobacteria bacterium]MBU0885976.1 dipeptide epimerase [Alphaproteobacteria bacterium]MBU1811965.1 dipeptide epimerase [Alphaproteobacteria bacterium]MBU2090308.1 dipeptide epimerase [Alphaproteobacteria bacterium]